MLGYYEKRKEIRFTTETMIDYYGDPYEQIKFIWEENSLNEELNKWEFEGERKKLYSLAIHTNGQQKQMIKAAEEASELSRAILKLVGVNMEKFEVSNMFEEIADVKIMIEQLILMLANEMEIDPAQIEAIIEGYRNSKLDRLEEKIHERI